jgi:hypothetical protein
MAYDPRFTPPRMTAEFVRDAIKGLAARTGLLHADRADWMIDLIIEGDQSGIPPDRTIIKDPRFPETLSEVGMADPAWALAAILRAAPFARDQERNRATALSLGRQQRFTPVQDKKTCGAAKARHGELFQPGSEPLLPLPECDVWNCRCTFIGWDAADEARWQKRMANRQDPT